MSSGIVVLADCVVDITVVVIITLMSMLLDDSWLFGIIWELGISIIYEEKYEMIVTRKKLFHALANWWIIVVKLNSTCAQTFSLGFIFIIFIGFFTSRDFIFTIKSKYFSFFNFFSGFCFNNCLCFTFGCDVNKIQWCQNV